MKNFIKKALLFLLPIIILCLVFELLLRNIPNDYTIKKNYLDKHSQNIEVLILGNSHFYRGLNPEYLTLKSFNASYVSQSLDIDAHIFKKYSDSLTHLKYLLLNVSHLSLFYELKNSPESWRTKNYNLYYDLPLSDALAQHTELFSLKFDITIKRLFSYYILKRGEITSNENGWGIFKTLHDKRGVKVAAMRTLSRRSNGALSNADYNHYNDVTKEVDDIVQLAKRKGVKVIFFTSPLSTYYREAIDKNLVDKTNVFMESLVSKYDNCQYFDLSQDASFNDEDFYDGDHLNKIGSKKFTLKADSVIMKDESDKIKMLP
ncbi:MAG: hypothetical protein ABI266_06075 [Ginsengibacter sp.]